MAKSRLSTERTGEFPEAVRRYIRDQIDRDGAVQFSVSFPDGSKSELVSQARGFSRIGRFDVFWEYHCQLGESTNRLEGYIMHYEQRRGDPAPRGSMFREERSNIDEYYRDYMTGRIHRGEFID